MPSAEEDHDHDLPCYTRRRSDYHHRWIFWAVNVAPRQIQRSCRRVRQRETSATSESRQIGPKQHWWTPRPFQVARSSSIGISPLSTATATATARTVARSRCCRQAFCPRVPLLVLRIVAVFCLLLRLRVNVYASNLFIIRKEERRERGGKNGRRHELRTRTETRKAIADRTKNRRRRCLFARSSFVALASPSLTESPSSLVSFRFHALPSTDSMRG